MIKGVHTMFYRKNLKISGVMWCDVMWAWVLNVCSVGELVRDVRE